jgi:hypothetical protein
VFGETGLLAQALEPGAHVCQRRRVAGVLRQRWVDSPSTMSARVKVLPATA